MKNILLTVIAIVLIGALGFGVFAYFDTRDNVKNLDNSNKTEQTKNTEDAKDTKDTNNQESNEGSTEGNDTSENTDSSTPEMVDVLNMVDEGKDVNGTVDAEGNTWFMNPGIAVGYVNPKGEEYSTSMSYKGELDGTDFQLSNEDVEPSSNEPSSSSSNQGEDYPDPVVVNELKEEIRNAGLQSELDAKKQELADYINSFE